MAGIKTRKADKGTIKTLNKARVMRDKLKHSYAKTKERTENSYESQEQAPSNYAVDKISAAGKTIARKGGVKLNRAGEKSIAETQQNLESLKGSIKEKRLFRGIRTKGSIPFAAPKESEGSYYAVKRGKGKTGFSTKGQVQRMNRNTARRLRQQKMAKNLAQNRIGSGKKNRARARKTVSRMAHAIRMAAVSIRALFMAIFAGGWIAILAIMICCFFGAAFYFFGDDSSGNYFPVSAEVDAHTPTIKKYAKEYGIEEYTELIKAVMMQESGGKGKDPMQSSECGFNTKYPKKPGGITDPDYSIKCGVQNLKSVLEAAKVQSPVDMDRIKLALQGYNYGNGYIPWAIRKYGGYSKANAIEFSELEAKKHGRSSYGDKAYVDHVLRYYPYGDYSYDVIFNGNGKLGLPIKGMTKNNISSHFGPRASPGGIGSKYHQGLDIAFPMGTQILACESGTVTTAGWNGSLGKCVIINHDGKLETVYGHMSEIKVKSGQKVVRGQVIGKVGSTGNSTGPHLHLGVRVNGSYVNPEKGYLSIPE